MAITFDANADGKLQDSSSDLTVSHVLGGGSNRYVVAVQCAYDTVESELPGTPTYNGTAMNLAVSSTWASNIRVRVYYLGEASLPVAGTYDAVSPSGGLCDQNALYVYSYSGVNDAAPEATAVDTGSVSGTATFTVNITTLTDGARIVGGTLVSHFDTPTAQSGQTNVLVNSSTRGTGAGDEAIATAGSEAFSWSPQSSSSYHVAVIALEPAASETPVSKATTLSTHHQLEITKTETIGSHHFLSAALPFTLSTYHKAAVNAPTGVVASNPTDTTIDLAWTDTNSGTANPLMYRRTPAGSGAWTFVEKLATTATTYTFTGLAGGTQYDVGVSYIK